MGALVAAGAREAGTPAEAAVSALTKGAALDHIKDGIRINAVSPGATDTSMSLRPGETDADQAARLAAAVPAGRVASTGEIVNAVLWLASEESSFVAGTTSSSTASPPDRNHLRPSVSGTAPAAPVPSGTPRVRVTRTRYFPEESALMTRTVMPCSVSLKVWPGV